MKRIYTLLTGLAAALFVLTSCDDVLNIKPSDKFTDDIVWGDQEALDHYVLRFYAFLKDYCETSNFNAAAYSDAYSDILKSGSWNQYGHGYNTVVLQENSFDSDSAGSFECWSSDYNRIKETNEFLKDAATLGAGLDKDFLAVRIAEVRFVRAYIYWHLIRVYGGVVLRDQLDGPDQNDKPRMTEEQSWNFVIGELKESADLLPDVWTSRGRVTAAAAYGFLSRVGVYARKWDVAIEAAQACKEHGGKLDASYSAVFNNVTSPENLLCIEYVPSKITHRAEVFFRPVGDSKYHGNAAVYGVFGPTSELVDSYEMADGSEFSWDTCGDDPYVGREPRFYASIIYDGAVWEGRDVETCVTKNVKQEFYSDYGTSAQALVSVKDTTLRGEDRMEDFQTASTTNSTPTGYYLRKFITENSTEWETSGSTHYGFVIRYAEVLLNAAEAYAQKGDYLESMEALNEVRSRVGLPARAGLSTEQMMEHIRHERMVELAGEGFRYWDVRRWGLGPQIFNGQVVHGVRIVRNETAAHDSKTGNELSFKINSRTFQQVSADADRQRFYFERYDHFSIPITERSNNKLLGENNPGW